MATDRKPLRREEYFSVKFLMAINSAAEVVANSMGERVKSVGTYSRELARIRTTSDRLLDKVLKTVPKNQQDILAREMESTSFYIRTAKVGAYDNDESDYVSVSRANMKKMIAYIMHANCEMCDRTGKDARRCPVGRLLREACCYSTPYNMPDGTCFYNLYQTEYADDPLDRLEQCPESAYEEM